MAGRFVRSSKYRHVFGRPAKREQCYDNLHISKNAWDTNLVKVNPKYLSVNWEASGGGAFAVIPLAETGKLPDRIPLFRGHTSAVLDTDWSPFDDNLIASASDDGKVFIWKVPDNFTVRPDVKPEEIKDVEPIAKLLGHSRKVGHVLFNPAAQNVLASSSGDYTVKIWDLDESVAKLTLKHPDIVQSLSWSADGAYLTTTCRDKKLRVWDVRQEKPVLESAGHSGAKNSRAVWLGEHDRIATTGFSKMSDRQLALWDVRAGREPLDGFTMLDQMSGVCIPFWDEGTQMLFLAGKGDGNIRYYEYQNDKFEYLSAHSSSDPLRGLAFMPKRGINTHENEVMRAYRTIDDKIIEPIAFIVPRRAEVFQTDIFPPTVGTKPAMSSAEYFAGKTGVPPKFSMESMHEGSAAKEVAPSETPKSFEPIRAASPEPVVNDYKSSYGVKPKDSPKPAAEPKPAPVTRGPAASSVNDSKSSIAAIASKFDEQDDDDDDDDKDSTGSFEEVQKPVERPTATSSSSKPQPAASDYKSSYGVKPSSTISSPVVSTAPPEPETPKALDTSSATLPKASEQPAGLSHRSTPSGTVAEGLRGHLQDIKLLLETQNKTILAQGEQLVALTKEVELLKTSNGTSASDASKDERIRMLELELEEAKGR